MTAFTDAQRARRRVSAASFLAGRLPAEAGDDAKARALNLRRASLIINDSVVAEARFRYSPVGAEESLPSWLDPPRLYALHSVHQAAEYGVPARRRINGFLFSYATCTDTATRPPWALCPEGDLYVKILY